MGFSGSRVHNWFLPTLFKNCAFVLHPWVCCLHSCVYIPGPLRPARHRRCGRTGARALPRYRFTSGRDRLFAHPSELQLDIPWHSLGRMIRVICNLHTGTDDSCTLVRAVLEAGLRWKVHTCLLCPLVHWLSASLPRWLPSCLGTRSEAHLCSLLNSHTIGVHSLRTHRPDRSNTPEHVSPPGPKSGECPSIPSSVPIHFLRALFFLMQPTLTAGTLDVRVVVPAQGATEAAHDSRMPSSQADARVASTELQQDPETLLRTGAQACCRERWSLVPGTLDQAGPSD